MYLAQAFIKGVDQFGNSACYRCGVRGYGRPVKGSSSAEQWLLRGEAWVGLANRLRLWPRTTLKLNHRTGGRTGLGVKTTTSW